MELYQTFDPRDLWATARRIEVYRHAKEHNVPDISEDMPKDLIVKRCKAAGLPPPSVPRRPIGSVDPRIGDTNPNSHHAGEGSVAKSEEVETIDADDNLEREWKTQQQKPVNDMNINELRGACKAKGIKLSRRDNMQAMKAKLSG